MSTFFYLGPIRTNESQRAINKQKLPQMTFWGLFICKQTFSQNVAKFRLLEPSTYEWWHICPLFFFLGPIRTNWPNTNEYVRIGPIRTQRTFNVQTLPQMIFWGLFRCKQTFFTPKVDQVIQDFNDFFLGTKITFFEK